MTNPQENLSSVELERFGIDTSVAHSARMYDYWLDGKTNFAPDRSMSDTFQRTIPSIRTMAQENRSFLGRAVRYLTEEAGLRQFLDVGTGIPTQGNTHQVAQRTAPQTQVVYVDNDPIVLAHARALMDTANTGRTNYVHADLREPERLLTDDTLADTLDLSQPVGLILVAILMLLEDEEEPWARVQTLLDALPSGSHVAITHPSQDFDPPAVAEITAAARQGGMTLVPRERDEVLRLFGGWELVEPGLVPVTRWRPEAGTNSDPNAAYYYAGVARKP